MKGSAKCLPGLPLLVYPESFVCLDTLIAKDFLFICSFTLGLGGAFDKLAKIFF